MVMAALAACLVVVSLQLALLQLSSHRGKRGTSQLADAASKLRQSTWQGTSPRQQSSQPTSLEAFKARNAHLKKACAARQQRAQQPAVWNGGPMAEVLWLSSLSYCAVPKTGSTFWKRVLFYLDKGLRGPLLDQEYGDIHLKAAYLKAPRRATKHTTRIVLTREPYQRLFSAYVNKLFQPRAKNWKRFASPAMRFSRPNASLHELRCSHNVTFAEFVDYVIHAQRGPSAEGGKLRLNPHFMPVSRQCDLCGARGEFGIDGRPHTLIGRQESFAEDTLGMLALFNLSSVLTRDDLHVRYARYEIVSLIRYTFQHELRNIVENLRCMSREEVLRRVWKDLQMRGILSAEDLFPLTKAQSLEVTEKGFLRLAGKAHNRSLLLRTEGRPQSVKDSHVEGYSTVPLSQRLELRRIFEEDFVLFGYDPSPASVFPAGDKFALTGYRYLDVFDSLN